MDPSQISPSHLLSEVVLATHLSQDINAFTLARYGQNSLAKSGQGQ